MNTSFRNGLVLAALAPLAPLAANAAEYATVVSSTPVTASVNVPRRVCSEAQQYVQPQPSGAGAVIGAIAGGLLGNTVGGGFGRAAATGVGAVAGAAIGNSVEANAYPPATVPVQRCQTVSGYENRTVGYDVVYEYNGRRYTTRLARDPGPQLAIDVRPAGASSSSSLDRLGPPVASGGVPQDDVEGPPQAYDAPPVAVAPRPVYYYGQPAYVVAPPAYVVAPAIGFSLGYWGGRHHWR
jgi:uncharacterized protein YcfJ